MAAKILDQDGREIPAAEIARTRARALIGNPNAPYDAADRSSAEMAGWNAYLGAPDVETTPNRDLAVARIRDMVRNDGWASGTVTKTVDAAIGADFRLSARPDYRALARWYGPGFDAVWAKEFADAAEAGFRLWACEDDPARWCDAERKDSFTEKSRLGFRHYLVEGEVVGPVGWHPERIGYGGARYGTTMHLVDPDRLSNPNLAMDTTSLRGGVELDDEGLVPVAYHLRGAHIGEWWAAAKSVTWTRVPRETSWGRPGFVHFYDRDRAGDHRPVGGIFTPVLARMRMLAQYDRLEVQAAIINAIFGAFIESPFDADDVQKSLEDDAGQISAYQQLRSDFHADNRLSVGSVRLAKLFPGEQIKTVSSSRPAGAFDMFEAAMLRNLAVATGSSFETVSANFRGSTYSSARQALLEAWRTLYRRRRSFGRGWATPHYVALLEEMIEYGDVPLPRGAPDFAEARAWYARCSWMGPGRGWVDPTKEPEGSRMKIASGLSTLEREAAENDGSDWEENLDQLALEQKAAKDRGLTLTFEAKGGDGTEPPPEKPEDAPT